MGIGQRLRRLTGGADRPAPLVPTVAPAVVLTGVSHGYDGPTVLRDVDLTVERGRCVALLGENGSGKSTLLRLVAGRETPDEGTVTVLGRTADEDDPAQRRAVAAVLDSGIGYPDLTVREHLLLVALAHGLGEDAADRVDEVLAELHIAARAEALPKELSAGQTQLLMLSQAFVRPPAELLLLDEPEQRIDTAGRGRIAARIASARAAGGAVLFATHDRQLAHEVADVVLTFTEDGSPQLRPVSDADTADG
ncbi:ATP-binding cassette domain-containing protein [Streptomyces spiramenti]|uniref:ABC transporter ATP-binding protein n=1 Tax=Streptomyces spiramenti TaxID=2720606 RepID=A0ABX1AV26_9ACTN|nr:ABC transporter ATP-binding protein [Streptomyces spiramenti]NJP68127.1 ABC transporter ATP-binding protein [Streptomyces spiramenti]